MLIEILESHPRQWVDGSDPAFDTKAAARIEK